MVLPTYQAPVLMVDGVVLQLINDRLHVLLIQRANEPFSGMYALPGGYIVAGETTHFSLARILSQKADIRVENLAIIEQLYTFDTVARDPRGHAVSVTYMGLGYQLAFTGQPDAHNPCFVAVDELPELAYDHAEIIAYAHDRLKSKMNYTNVVFALLPKRFTLTQLQSAYEAILQRQLDKRNFRKKFLSLDTITPTNEYFRDGAHRPAQLYEFNVQRLVNFAKDF